MILACKNGWLILVRVQRATRSGSYVKPIDEPSREFFVSKKDTQRKLFDDVTDATAFILENNT